MDGLDLARAERALQAAKAERAAHSQICESWDYESNGGCTECDYVDVTVNRARTRLERVREALGL